MENKEIKYLGEIIIPELLQSEKEKEQLKKAVPFFFKELLYKYKKIYQGCDKCNKENIHIIENNFVICTNCNSAYAANNSGRNIFYIN